LLVVKLIFGFHYINPFLELVNSHVAKIATNFPSTLRQKIHMGFDSSTNIATHATFEMMKKFNTFDNLVQTSWMNDFSMDEWIFIKGNCNLDFTNF